MKYSPRFPELEGLIYNPSEYARVVKTIGDIEDLTEVDFKSILPPQLVMSVTIMGSTTKGKKLPKEEHDVVMQAVDDVITMSNYKRVCDGDGDGYVLDHGRFRSFQNDDFGAKFDVSCWIQCRCTDDNKNGWFIVVS